MVQVIHLYESEYVIVDTGDKQFELDTVGERKEIPNEPAHIEVYSVDANGNRSEVVQTFEPEFDRSDE